MYCEKFITMVMLAVMFLIAVGAVYIAQEDQFGRFTAYIVAAALSSFIGFGVANVVANCRSKA